MSFQLTSPSKLNLQRYPKNKDQSLRAWNAADELIIEHLNHHLTKIPRKTLIINDQFGALSICLEKFSPMVWSDSFLSQLAYQQNFANNQIDADNISILNPNFDNSAPFEQLKSNDNDKIDLLIIRIPKHNSLLQFQLRQIKPYLSESSIVIAAGMTKEIHNSNLKVFEDEIGTTKTSLAKKKARLVFSHPAEKRHESMSVSRYELHEYQLTIYGLAGVFSRQKLDIGTQVLLQHLPELLPHQKVIDLGCGSGVIAAVMASRYPDNEFTLTDESRLAIESAKLTFASNQMHNAQFFQTDCLKGLPDNHYDYVLCNPPFHQQNVQTLTIASTMFRQAAKKLKQDGELRVVANRHLKYRALLNRYFGQINPISADNKFTVWSAKSKK